MTHDLDYGELMAASEARLPSVIIFRLRDMRPQNLNGYMREIIASHQHALEQGAVMSVTERQVRVRLLPIRMEHDHR